MWQVPIASYLDCSPHPEIQRNPVHPKALARYIDHGESKPTIVSRLPRYPKIDERYLEGN